MIPSPTLHRLLVVGLTLGAVAWAGLLVALPAHVAGADSSRLGVLVYGAGALVCHQRPDRSFHVEGVRLPVCARCTGLYLSGALGALAGWLGGAGEPRRSRALLMASWLPIAVSVGVEWAGIAAPGNLSRAASAVPAGALAGWLAVRMLRGEHGSMRYHQLI